MRVLRYGATATWIFRGFSLDPGQMVATAFLTFKDAWATSVQEQAPNDPHERLQLAVTPTQSDEGIVSTDEDGNWVASFHVTADETSDELGPGDPPTRYLYYEVTLILDDPVATLRPIVGTVRMLPDVYTPAASS